MHIPPEVARKLLCPICGDTLEGNPAVCTGTGRHPLEIEDETFIFARPEIGKYQPGYASRYAALWAFGHATRQSGLDEPLYRTVSSFLAEALVSRPSERPFIVDAGCGVGRVTGDCARLAPTANILALDASPPMLAFARRVVQGKEAIEVDLPEYGFPRLTIPAYGLDGPMFARADVERLPIADGSVDIILSVNIIDRLPRGPELMFRECQRVLKSGGTLIFTDPLNWTEPWLWERYPAAASVLALMKETGFTIQTWFDDLMYREILDGRGSFDEFRTVACRARKG
ncbi:MAG: class I SAM-dependent methyltransferase [Acidobacteriota bacterium]|nr:class I SAM-dependent methyltransferase [Acidobacteriota bacterium]